MDKDQKIKDLEKQIEELKKENRIKELESELERLKGGGHTPHFPFNSYIPNGPSTRIGMKKTELINKIMNGFDEYDGGIFDRIEISRNIIEDILQENIPEDQEDIEPVNQKELDDRDNVLATIFNTTRDRGDMYMKIIAYLVEKGFLQKGDGSVEKPSKEDVVEIIKKPYIDKLNPYLNNQLSSHCSGCDTKIYGDKYCPGCGKKIKRIQ